MRFDLVAQTLLAAFPFASPQSIQQLLGQEEPRVNAVKVAIVGAGAAGTSTAYHLAQYALNASIPIDITVFEANNHVGGRSTTVNAYDLDEDTLGSLRLLDPSHTHKYTVELGASIFVDVNRILTNAVSTFNLSLQDGSDNPKGRTGSELAIWDGERFVIELDGNLDGYWDIAKLIWRYGLAPIKTQRLMKSVVARFLSMYDQPVFPFSSLTAAAQAVGLLPATATTGQHFMEENGIGGAFGREIVQASTRVNYAQNLEHVHGLEAMVCMATDGAVAVAGGNWQIFKSMLKASKARVHLGERIEHIQKHESGGFSLSSGSTVWEGDHVIVAGPWQFTNMTVSISDADSKPSTFRTPDTIPYVELHVTLFASHCLLDPKYFGLSADKLLPQIILTTLPASEPAKSGRDSVGKPGFFSISLLRSITNPRTGADEYLYKIFSPTAPTDDWLKEILAINQTTVLRNHGADVASGANGTTSGAITWLYRKIWNAYPYEYPRVTFEDPILAPGLWYTGGMDSFISTMETNALMGRNVARLIIDAEMASRR